MLSIEEPAPTVARARTRPIPAAALPAPAPMPPLRSSPALRKTPQGYPVMTYQNMIALNKRTAKLVADFRIEHQQWRERVLLQALSSSEFVMLTAIVARTFSWGKLFESISLDQLVHGIRTKSDVWAETGGVPVFRGTGLDRKTVMKALQGLHDQGLIERFCFPLLGRDTCAWSPMSAWNILNLLDGGDDIFAPLRNVTRTSKDGAFPVRPLELDFKARFTQPLPPAELDADSGDE